jgi:hypothetical protein
MRYWVKLFFLLVLGSSVCQAQVMTKYPCSKQDIQLIKNTMADYLYKTTKIPLSNSVILDEQCVGDYASLKLHPKKPTTDDAMVYLHKVKGIWEVMALGTFFDEKFLKQLPKELR